MTEPTVAARIGARAQRAGVTVSPILGVSLAAYLELLARWNGKINLTALDVDGPSDEAIDRLIIEPLVAAEHIRPSETFCIDVGSGGGSPAIPLKLAVPRLRVMLVEAKVRKSAFLREAVRQLGLSSVEVENRRFEELLGRAGLIESADLVTIRAVRVDRTLLGGIAGLLRPGGRLFWFDSSGSAGPRLLPDGLQAAPAEPLIPALGSTLRIVCKIQ